MDYHFSVEHARRWGVEEAIFLQNLIYWLRHNKANKKAQRDGHTWSYNTLEAFVALFPFWSVGQIRRIISSLVKQGVILKGSFNDRAYDRTCWYALVDESLLELEKPICRNQQMEMLQPADAVVETSGPIPDLKQDMKKKEAQAHEPEGMPSAPRISLSSLLDRIRAEAKARGDPASFISKRWVAGIVELERSGMPEGELIDVFRVCLEIAPERVTFFPQDFLKWRKVSRQRKANEVEQQQRKREREERERAREVERERILAEREDPQGARVVKAAIAGLPWN